MVIKFWSFDKVLNWTISLVIKYPASKSLSYFWNGGSILGIILSFQIARGILLVFFYSSNIFVAFSSIDFIRREVFWGFLIRSFHLNIASLFFLILYLHILRGFLIRRYRIEKPWLSGTTILLITIIVAFLGYVLPWGQISFWGATVITNLISTFPIFGPKIVIWIWGGYNVGNGTLGFFFSLHFIFPFVIFIIVLFHLIYLHETRRRRRLIVHERFSKIKFFPYFIIKDLLNLLIFTLFFLFIFIFPWNLGDPENWILANPIMSPIHIQPEWYFLFAYAILRCIPRKLGGVIALVLRVVFLYFIPLFQNYKTKRKLFIKISVRTLFFCFILLTWLGACLVEEPFILIRQIFRFFYFVILIIFCVI